jgi:carboxylesterase
VNDERYRGALLRFERIARRDVIRADEACRSSLLAHGGRTERATLFLHGITASPRQFAALAQHAHACGDNVLVPRLPRHGHPDRRGTAMQHLTAHELLAGVEEHLEIARGIGSRVRIVGFSLGGLLSIWLGHRHYVDEVIAISPFLGIAGVPSALSGTVASLLRRLPNAFLWWDPIRRDALMPAHGYPRFATHAIAETLGLAVEVLQLARSGSPRSPLTLVVNDGEAAVNNAAVSQLERSWEAHGVQVELRRLRGLGRSHDIIEPLRTDAKVARSYPQLLPLLGRR